MDYQTAKAHAEHLWQASKAAATPLEAYPRNAMGLVSDDVRRSPEYQAAKQSADRAFIELQRFNIWYVKTFKNELRADRAAKRSA